MANIHSLLIQIRAADLPEANSIRANLETATRSPDILLTDIRAGLGSVDHLARPGEDADVGNRILAVTILTPEEHITGLGLAARDMLAHLGVILSLCSTSYKVLVTGRTSGVGLGNLRIVLPCALQTEY